MSKFLVLFDLIGELGRRRYQEAEKNFAAIGLNHTEARLLTLLTRAGGEAAQDKLSANLSVDRSNAGRALQRLEQAAYIARQKDGTDKRANFVQITPKGRRAAAEISKLKSKMAADFFGDLTDAEAGTVIELLGKAPRQEGAEPGRR